MSEFSDMNNSHRKKLDIPGYSHPTKQKVSNRNCLYKTFSEGERKKKDMTKFKTIEVGDSYSVNKISEEVDKCPKCNSPAISICNCAYSCRKCKNGHVWYIDRTGENRIGNPHKR